MGIRESQECKEMSSYLAVGYAEGFEEAESEEQVLAAWQYIHDTGMTASLQGFFRSNRSGIDRSWSDRGLTLSTN